MKDFAIVLYSILMIILIIFSVYSLTDYFIQLLRKKQKSCYASVTLIEGLRGFIYILIFYVFIVITTCLIVFIKELLVEINIR